MSRDGSEADWLAQRATCSCSPRRQVPDRRYLNVWCCRRCSLSIRDGDVGGRSETTSARLHDPPLAPFAQTATKMGQFSDE
jgi:hypothetical protein